VVNEENIVEIKSWKCRQATGRTISKFNQHAAHYVEMSSCNKSHKRFLIVL